MYGHPPMKPHILFYESFYGGHFEFDRVGIFQDASSAEISHFINYSNGLAI